MCGKPFRQGVMEYGCGQCLPCRLNRRRLWTGRLMLESKLHSESVFVTLTYDEKHVPADGNLEPDVLRDFLKRLRSRIEPRRLRYFVVGEYGDQTERPHYHAVLFGVGLGDRAQLQASWDRGFVHVGTLTEKSAGYVVSYTLKRMTRAGDPRLEGRVPEFARMSLKPGIGAVAMEEIANALRSKIALQGAEEDAGPVQRASAVDVPSAFRSGGQSFPFGRYLKGKAREYLGADRRTPEAVVAAVAATVRDRLRSEKGRTLHEGKRLQSVRRAERLVSISNSKKGM